MKTLIKVLLFTLIGLSAKAQLPSSTFPSRIFNGNTKAQWILLDSPVVNPILDTFHARYAGTQMVRIQGGDTAFWFYGGNRRWFRSLLDRDTLSLSNRINLKLNISDTAGKWLAQSTRLVDTMYRVNDSTIGYTIKGNAYTFQILGGSSGGGGGSGTVTSVGLSLPSAFNVTPSTITTSGTFNVSGAGTASQYIRGNGTLATTDTGMIPDFYSKVRPLFSVTSPLTFNSVTGVFGVGDANTSGTKGVATFSSSSFSDNGSGTISLADVTTAGSCINCEITFDAKGRATSFANGTPPQFVNASGAGDTLSRSDTLKRLNPGYGLLHLVTDNNITQRVDTSLIATQYDLTQIPSTSLSNIGGGFRWVATPGGNIKTVFSSNTIIWDSTSTANTLTAKADTSVLATQYDLTQITPGRTGVLPTIYPGATVTIDTAGKILNAEAIRNNLGSFNGVSDTTAFGKSAAYFNISDSQALITPSNPTLQGGAKDITIAAWVKATSFPGTNMIIAAKDDNRTKRGSEYLLGYVAFGTNKFQWQIEECCHAAPNDGNTWAIASSTPTPSAGQWYFVVGQYDHVGGKIKIWVNMVKDSLTGVPNLSNTTLTPFTIGGLSDDYDTTGLPECCSFWDGAIMSVGYWNRVLDSTELALLYNNISAPLPPPGLNPGTMSGAVFSADVPGVLSSYVNSVNFDGVNDKISFSGVTLSAGTSSISCWFKADAFGGVTVGQLASSNAYIRVFNSTTIRVQTNVTGTFKDYTVPTMSTGTWYNLIITRGASDLTHVYLNGTESSSGGQSQTDPFTIDQIGAYWDGLNGLMFDGKISDVRVYNSVLSGTDIANIQTNAPTTAVPLLWYKLNEGTGVINIDYGTAAAPRPLIYSELPVNMVYEPSKTFVSWWDLSESEGVRYDARLRNVIRDSVVTNLLVDISRQKQTLYGSTLSSVGLDLRATTNGSPTTGADIKLFGATKAGVTVFNSSNVSIGDSLEFDDLSIVTSTNAAAIAGRRNDGLKLWGLASDVSGNVVLESANYLQVTSGNSNAISLVPATGVTVGTARSTDYKLDVLESRTGRIDTTIAGYFAMSGSTYNTTGDSALPIAVYALADGTRASGSNPLKNIAIYGRAENGQENYALKLDGGFFNFNDVQAPPSTYNILVHGLTDSNVYQIPMSSLSVTTLYTGDGTVSGNRNVNLNNLNLTFTDVNTFRINHDVFAQSRADGTFAYSNVIVAPAQQLWVAYTPTAGVYSKGAALIIDTNNNVSIGSGVMPSTAPLYTAGSAYIQGLQSSNGNLYRVDNFTADQTINLTHYWVNVDATSGNVTITLPAASSAFGAGMGIQYVFRRVDNSGNTVTIVRSGSDTINGATSVSLTTQYAVEELQCVSTSAWALKQP